MAKSAKRETAYGGLDTIRVDELCAAKFLTGSAKYFDFEEELIERMTRHGIAASTEDGLMRGYLWHQHLGN